MFETAVSAILDEFPQLMGKRKTIFIALLCLVLFLLGLTCITQAGIYVVQLMDFYCAAFSLMVISLLETIVISWVYGIDRFLLDISLMTKKVPSLWWKLCWCYITPFTITALLLFIVFTHTSVKYNNYVYPSWSIVVGWMIAMCSIAPIPVVAVIKIIKTDGTLKQRLVKNLRPFDWGPALEENQIQYKKSLSAVPTKFKPAEFEAHISDIAIFPRESGNILAVEDSSL